MTPGKPTQVTADRDRPERYHILAGPKGEPPRELLDFDEPVELIDAGGYLDGGTQWAHLRDSSGYDLLLNVTPDDEEITNAPTNSLMLGATHSGETSARLPLSQAEARRAVGILKRATAALREAISNNSVEPIETAIRVAEYAESILSRLGSVKSFSLADPVELATRAARLRAIDLHAMCTRFRSLAGRDREEVLEQMMPALAGDFRCRRFASKDEVALAVRSLLGEPEPAALAAFGSMVTDTLWADRTPIHDDVFAYLLTPIDASFCRCLLVDFRHGEPVLSVVAGTGYRP